MLISMLVGWRLKSAFKEYMNVPLRSGLTGREVAEKMLRDNGIYNVKVVCVQGMLTDHFNPQNMTVNLSPDVYEGRSVSAAAVAAHECGHAVQHATQYPYIEFRSKMVPIVSVASTMMNFIMMAGMIGFAATNLFRSEWVLWGIIIAQSAITLFSLVTLPVEFDASKRGLVWLESTGLTVGEEHDKAKHALRLAATTYVVAALSAVATLLYFILRLVGSRD